MNTQEPDSTEQEIAKAKRNARVATRWDELTAAGKHGHYETLFQVVREEIDRARSVVHGWRENDWPEGFDRRTAQVMADRLSDQI